MRLLLATAVVFGLLVAMMMLLGVGTLTIGGVSEGGADYKPVEAQRPMPSQKAEQLIERPNSDEHKSASRHHPSTEHSKRRTEIPLHYHTKSVGSVAHTHKESDKMPLHESKPRTTQQFNPDRQSDQALTSQDELTEADYEDLVKETIASDPPQEKGERREWAMHTGWGRKEQIFTAAHSHV